MKKRALIAGLIPVFVLLIIPSDGITAEKQDFPKSSITWIMGTAGPQTSTVARQALMIISNKNMPDKSNMMENVGMDSRR